MQSGAPALVMEFDTAAVSFNQSVSVLLTNTGSYDTFAYLILTPTLNNYGDPQQVDIELPAGQTTAITLTAIDGKGGDASWLTIRVGSDQIAPTASFWNFKDTLVASYLPGSFAIFNLLEGKSRLG